MTLLFFLIKGNFALSPFPHFVLEDGEGQKSFFLSKKREREIFLQAGTMCKIAQKEGEREKKISAVKKNFFFLHLSSTTTEMQKKGEEKSKKKSCFFFFIFFITSERSAAFQLPRAA